MGKVVILTEMTLAPEGKERYRELGEVFGPRMADLEGYLGGERFQSMNNPDRFLSLHVWESEEAVAKWRNNPEHREAQKEAREKVYADYKIIAAHIVREYSKEDRDEAPADSNKCLID